MNKYESAINSSKYYLGSGSMPSIPLPDSILQTRYNLINPSSSKGFNRNLPNIFSAAGQAQFQRKPQAVMPQEDLKDWLIGKAPEPGSIGQSVQMFLNQSTKPSISFNYSSISQPNTNKLEAIRINQAPNNLTSNNLDNSNNQAKEEEQQQRSSGVGRRLRRIKSDIIINLNPKEDSNFKANKEPVITSLSHITFDKNSIQQQAQEQQDRADAIENKKAVRKGRKTQSLVPTSSSVSEEKFKNSSTLQMSSPAPKLKPISVFASSTPQQASPLQALKESSANSEIANEPHNTIMNTSQHKLNKLFSSSNTSSPQINTAHKTLSSKQSLLKDLQSITDSRKLLDMQLSSQNSPYSTAEQSPTEDPFFISSSTHLCLPKIQTRPKNISSIFRHQDFSPETQILQNSHNLQGKEEESHQLQQSDFEITHKPAEPKIIRLSQKPKQLDAFLSQQQPDRNFAASNTATLSSIPKVMFSEDSTKTSAQDIFYTTKSAIFSQIWDQTDSPQEKTPYGRPQSRATRGILKNMSSPTAMRKKQVIFDKNLKVYELSQQS